MSQSDIGDRLEVSRAGRPATPRGLCGDILQFVEFLTIVATSLVVAYLYHRFSVGSQFDYQSYAAAGIIGATASTALLRRDGFYEFEKLLDTIGVLRAVTSRWAMVLLGLLAFGFALKVSESFSRVWLFGWALTTPIILIFERWATQRIIRGMLLTGGAFSRRVAIVGATPLAIKFANRMKNANLGLTPVGPFATGLDDSNEDDAPCRW